MTTDDLRPLAEVCAICGPNYAHDRHEDDSYGSCVLCRQYVPHTDEDYTLVPWPCPTARLHAAEARCRALEEALGVIGVIIVSPR